MGESMKRWETRGGKYAIEANGTTVSEYTNGRETAFSVGHADMAAAVKEAERRVALYASFDKINFKEVVR